MQALKDIQQSFGAEIEAGIPVDFNNGKEALDAVVRSVALYDRSHWGRIRVFDRDRLSFLHNQTSNDFKRLQPGQGCEAVILTSTARTIDLVSAYVCDEDVMLLTAPGGQTQIMTWLDRYIFFGDKVQLADISDTTVCFSLMGPSSADLLMKLGLSELPDELDAHCLGEIAQVSVRIALGSGLSTPGYTLIADQEQGSALWQGIAEAGAVLLGERVWERLRIVQGRPMPGSELTEDSNPLEAGLWQWISFNKGCYIGQETIARLNTYNGVKQQLWGLVSEQPIAAGALIYVDEQKVGIVTSAVGDANGFVGLGYIKTKAGGAGLSVRVGEHNATVVDVPFLTRSLIGMDAV